MTSVATHFTFLNCQRCFQTQVSHFFVTHGRWRFWGHFSHLTLTSRSGHVLLLASLPESTKHRGEVNPVSGRGPGQRLKDEDQTLQVQVRRCCNSLTHNLVFWSSDAAEAYKRFAGAPQVTPVEKSATLARKATTSAEEQQQLWPSRSIPLISGSFSLLEKRVGPC